MRPFQPGVQVAAHQRIAGELKEAFARFLAVSQKIEPLKADVPDSVRSLLEGAAAFLPMVHGMDEVVRLRENLRHYIFRLSARGVLEFQTELDALGETELEISEDLRALNMRIGQAYLSRVMEEVNPLHALHGDAQGVQQYWMTHKGGSPKARDRAKRVEKEVREAWKKVAEGVDTLGTQVSVYRGDYLTSGEKLRADARQALQKLQADVESCIKEIEDRVAQDAAAEAKAKAVSAASAAPVVPDYTQLKSNLTAYGLKILLAASQVSIVYAERYVSSFDDASRGEFGAEFTVTGTVFVIHTHHKGSGTIKVAHIKRANQRHQLGGSLSISEYYLKDLKDQLSPH